MNSKEAVEYLRELEAVADAARVVVALWPLGACSREGQALADALDALDGKVSG